MKANQLIQDYIANNHFGAFLGMQFNILEPGKIEYALTTEEKHLATPNAVHGGCTAALLDATMGVGALTLVAVHFQVVATLEMKVSYFDAARLGDKLMATSRVVKQGKRLIFMEADVKNQEGVLLARSSGTFTVFSAEKSGYEPKS